VCSLEDSATQKMPTEIWEDNASCIMMSENLTHRNRSRHVDVKVHYLHDLVQNGHLKFVKGAGTQKLVKCASKCMRPVVYEVKLVKCAGSV
jgi:hypothetical protein